MNNTNKYVKLIIDKIEEMQGSKNPYTIFTDWVQLYAIAIANSAEKMWNREKPTAVYQQREQRYLNMAKQYSQKEMNGFAILSGHLINALNQNREDILGEIFMQLDYGSKHTGQVFTPKSLCSLCSQLLYKDKYDELKKKLQERKTISILEPSCGSGNMIIPLLDRMFCDGINYQRKEIEIIAQDVDIICVSMCYIELSLLGVNGIVVHDNTLTNPYKKGVTAEENIYKTPLYAVYNV